MSGQEIKGVADVLAYAIRREAEAYNFYMKLAAMVESEEMATVMESLAAEELIHKQRLEAIKAGEIVIEPEEIVNTGIADHLVDVTPHATMSYVELLLLGIKKEDKSRKLYGSMAAVAGTEELRDILLQMAQEEAEHKLRFEVEYELMTFGMKK